MGNATGARMPRMKLSASIMCANLMNLGADVEALRSNGFDYLHFDLMDGHFVPEIGLGIRFLEEITKASRMRVDVHLMVTDPDRFIEPLIRAGASLICVHQESAGDVGLLLKRIRVHGALAGLALRPETDLASVLPLADLLDLVLLMAYAPGTRDQKPVSGFERRIGELNGLLGRRGNGPIDIAVDGGVSQGHLQAYRDAGATFFILGTSGLFIPGTKLTEQIDRIRRILDGRRSRG